LKNFFQGAPNFLRTFVNKKMKFFIKKSAPEVRCKNLTGHHWIKEYLEHHFEKDPNDHFDIE